MRSGKIQHQHLITIRRGEISVSPLSSSPKPARTEFIKLMGSHGDWTCLFLKRDTNLCGIYSHRPLECRTLQCWNTRPLLHMAGKDLLCRADLMNPDDPMLQLLKDHEQECSWENINRLLPLSAQKTTTRAALAQLSNIVRLDLQARQRARQEFGLPDHYELFIFGRPIFVSLSHQGISTHEDGGDIRLERQRS